jgi:hypothetical protein
MGAIASPTVVRVAQAEARRHDAVRREDGPRVARLLSWLRRLTGARAEAAEAPLRAEARLHLGPKKSLVLVSCCGRRVLVGLSGEAMVLLGEWPGRREPGAGRGAAARNGTARSAVGRSEGQRIEALR